MLLIRFLNVDQWTYQLEVVLHSFTLESTRGPVRHIRYYEAADTGLFSGSSEVGESPVHDGVEVVRELGNFRYILIPEIINKFMTIISDPVRTEHVHVFKLNLK
jgi:hypothetical protein